MRKLSHVISLLGLAGILGVSACSPTDLGPAPIVSDISVHTAKTSGGVEAILSGQNFLNEATVTFGNKPSPFVQVLSPTQIKLIIPENYYAVGRSVITVTHPDKKSGSNDKIFSYLASEIGFELRANSILPAPYNPTGVSLADLDKDGKLDIVFSNLHGPSYPAFPNACKLEPAPPVNTLFDALGISHGLGQGLFEKPQYSFIGQGTEESLVADVNQDGIPDLLTLSLAGHVSVLMNLGNRIISNQVSYYAQSGQVFAVGDLNGDQIPDLVVGLPSSVSVFFATAPGVFGPETKVSNYQSGNIEAIAVVDLNKDGKNDIVAINSSSNKLIVLTNQGMQGNTLKFTPNSPAYFDTAGIPYAMKINDFNNDGTPDVVTAVLAQGKEQISYLQGTINNGTISFSPAKLSQVGNTFSSEQSRIIPYAGSPVPYPEEEIQFYDIDGDGILDILITNAYNHKIVAMKGDGRGNFAVASSITVGDLTDAAQPRSLAIGDIDGDGNVDAVVGVFDNLDGQCDRVTQNTLTNTAIQNLVIVYGRPK